MHVGQGFNALGATSTHTNSKYCFHLNDLLGVSRHLAPRIDMFVARPEVLATKTTESHPQERDQLRESTLVLELATVREAAATGAAGVERHPLRTVLEAVRSGIVHPVPLPIIIGLLFAQTGWLIPPVLDRPMQLLGNAFGPLALVLVGVSLTRVPVGAQLKAALGLSLLKNLLLPALVAALGVGLCPKLRGCAAGGAGQHRTFAGTVYGLRTADP
jgi:predicted permease